MIQIEKISDFNRDFRAQKFRLLSKKKVNFQVYFEKTNLIFKSKKIGFLNRVFRAKKRIFLLKSRVLHRNLEKRVNYSVPSNFSGGGI